MSDLLAREALRGIKVQAFRKRKNARANLLHFSRRYRCEKAWRRDLAGRREAKKLYLTRCIYALADLQQFDWLLRRIFIRRDEAIYLDQLRINLEVPFYERFYGFILG